MMIDYKDTLHTLDLIRGCESLRLAQDLATLLKGQIEKARDDDFRREAFEVNNIVGVQMTGRALRIKPAPLLYPAGEMLALKVLSKVMIGVVVSHYQNNEFKEGRIIGFEDKGKFTYTRLLLEAIINKDLKATTEFRFPEDEMPNVKSALWGYNNIEVKRS